MYGISSSGIIFPKNTKLNVINLSLSNKGIEIARLCNPLLDNVERSELRRFLETNFSRKPGENFGLFSEKNREIFLEYHKKSNENIFNEMIRL